MNKYRIMRLTKTADYIIFDLYNEDLKVNFELKFCCTLRCFYYIKVFNYYYRCYALNQPVTISEIENDFIIHKLKNNIP